MLTCAVLLLMLYLAQYALGHAPEELDWDAVSQEMADVYVTGNVMYYVLTKEWLFQRTSTIRSALQKLKRGERSPIPPDILNSTDRANKAMIKGINMLWTHNVEERPKARVVADYLLKELQEIEGINDIGGVVRVTNIPPLPPNHRFTDSDYERNLD